MSANLDLVRSIYADWERGDFSRGDWADPEIELGMPDMPDAGRWTGIPAIARAWRKWLASWSEYRAEPEVFREIDSTRVLVLVRSVARGKASGADVVTRNANVFEISDGKVTRITLCSLAHALADLGLEEEMLWHENVEIVRDHYAATNARDFLRAMSHYAEDVELVVPSGHLRSGTFRGASDVGRYFGEFFATFDKDARFDVKEIVEVNASSVLMTGVYHARGRASGVEIAGEVIWLYGLSDGRITSVRWFDSRAEALKTVAPEE